MEQQGIEAEIGEEYVLGETKPWYLRRWWLGTRPCKNAIQLNPNDGIPTCVEFYVPFWAWPFEVTYRLLAGSSRIHITNGKVPRPKQWPSPPK